MCIGLKATDRSKLRNVVALDFLADGRHLVIDAVMTIVYRNTMFRQVATVPGYAAKLFSRRSYRHLLEVLIKAWLNCFSIISVTTDYYLFTDTFACVANIPFVNPVQFSCPRHH